MYSWSDDMCLIGGPGAYRYSRGQRRRTRCTEMKAPNSEPRTYTKSASRICRS